MKEHIRKLVLSESLTADEATAAMESIMSGDATPAQIAAFLVALHHKGETAVEVAAFVEVMRRHAVGIELAIDRAIDSCGTGGDGANTFNISTTASFVAAAAGATVAKHGNRSVSSQCGSADILEACGGSIDPGVERVQATIDECGFAFLFAPRFHPAMKQVAGPRREIGVRTVFNILGPLSNPARVRRQVIGVFDKALVPLMVDALELAGSTHVLVAHSTDGLDEFSVSAPTGFIELKNGNRDASVITPEDVGLKRHPIEALAGGDRETNLKIMRAVLDGEPGACRDAAVLNAAAMIYVAGDVDSIADGVPTAQEAIDSGAARAKLDSWVSASNG